jgi:hypothetical protein
MGSLTQVKFSTIVLHAHPEQPVWIKEVQSLDLMLLGGQYYFEMLSTSYFLVFLWRQWANFLFHKMEIQNSSYVTEYSVIPQPMGTIYNSFQHMSAHYLWNIIIIILILLTNTAFQLSKIIQSRLFYRCVFGTMISMNLSLCFLVVFIFFNCHSLSYISQGGLQIKIFQFQLLSD